MADWGANVVRVEPTSDRAQSKLGKRDGPDEQNLHRNKRSICLNLKTSEGHKTFLELVKRADVVVENFRAPVKQRLKVDYDTLCKVNPKIILASISGFGQTGPYSDRGGVDQIVQGTSGLMSITGHKKHGPVRTGIAISDTTAGMFLGQGILLALLQRESTGRGQWVHTSLLEGMLCKLDFQGARFTMSGEIPEQQGNNHPTSFPMGTFRCKDGLVNIAAPWNRMWQNFLNAIDDDSLRHNKNYETSHGRNTNRHKLHEDIEDALKHFEVVELVERLNAAGVPCGAINSIGEAFEDVQAKHLRMTKSANHKRLGDIELIRSPINLSEHPHGKSFDRPAPDPGEHTRELLQEFGYDNQQIDALIDSRVAQETTK